MRSALCQHCGLPAQVEPVQVRPVRQPHAEPITVQWCGRCRSTPTRWVRFVPLTPGGGQGRPGPH